jgi:hypothetical protein
MDDWRSRAFQAVRALEQALGPHDVEVRRRMALWEAIDRADATQYREARFAQLELATRTEAELLAYALWHPASRAIILAAAPPGGAGASPASPTETAETQALPRAQVAAQAAGGGLPVHTPPPFQAAPPAPGPAPVAVPQAGGPTAAVASVRRFNPKTLSASALYAEGVAAWNELNEFERKDRARALSAADRLQQVMSELQYFPGDNPSLKALERIVGRTCREIVDGTLQRRLA